MTQSMLDQITPRIEDVRAELQQIELELIGMLRDERSCARGELNSAVHQVRQIYSIHYSYMSDAGQDYVVDQLLDGLEGGTFIDIGAYDGLSGSNTWFFETCRNWTGLLVEPSARFCAEAAAQRRSPCLQVAVAAQTGDAQFLSVVNGFTKMSGLVNDYLPEVRKTLKNNPLHEEEITTVQTVTIADLMDRLDTKIVDYISMDIEGGEQAALEGFPFDTYAARYWSIENNTGEDTVAKIMRGNGYQLIEFCGQDEIYEHRDLV